MNLPAIQLAFSVFAVNPGITAMIVRDSFDMSFQERFVLFHDQNLVASRQEADEDFFRQRIEHAQFEQANIFGCFVPQHV